MGFDIPMNTKGCLSAEGLLALNGGGGAPQNNGMAQAPTQNINYGQNQPVNYPQNQNYQQQNFQQQPQMQQPQPQMQQPQPQPQMQQAPVQQQRPQGGGVHLKKGQKFALAGAGGAQLNKIKVGLGWDILNQACDLDASAFMLDANNRVIGDDWFVFYGQTNSPDNSIQHSGDNTTGAGAGDDETISITLSMVNPSVQKIVFVVTINEALEHNLNFSMVANAYVRVIDEQTNTEIARFALTDYYANVTSMVVGELYRHNGQWKFNAVGDGVAKDLAGLCAMYGVNVAD